MPFLSAPLSFLFKNLISLSPHPGTCEHCDSQVTPLLEAVELNPEARLEGRVVYCAHCRKSTLQRSLLQLLSSTYCKSCRRCSAKNEVAVDREPQAVRVGRVKQTKQCQRCTEETHRILLIPRAAMPDAVIRRERVRKTSLGG